jgi:NAD-dependent dihydropyrimidine dehydrogenase PreA subunit
VGHLGRIKDEYRDLVGRLEAAQVSLPEPRDERAWQGWKEILEILYTPEEAAIAARLPTRPARLETIAKRVGLPPETLRAKLEPMCERGVVFDMVHPKTGETRYALSPPVVGFVEFSLMRAHDSIPKKRLAEALEAYFHHDDAFAREVFGGETVIGRALAHESVLGDDAPDVLDWERATSLISEATHLATSLCYCRHKGEHLGTACDAPQDVCLSLNGGAEHVIRRGFGRAIEKAEALDILARSRDLGLVQVADNVQRKPAYVCNCCGCCCEQLRSITTYGLPAVNPSGFQPVVDADRCKGCSRCARACPVAAFSMRPARAQGKRKNDLEPILDRDRCIGCGVCVGACGGNHALSLARVKRPEVPASGLERVVLMALERGHLPGLVFDEGEGRGSRFLAKLTRALASLPPVERALADRQLRSRFVHGMMERLTGKKLPKAEAGAPAGR